MILFWFSFSGCIKQDYKNKCFITGDWSQCNIVQTLKDVKKQNVHFYFHAILDKLFQNKMNLNVRDPTFHGRVRPAEIKISLRIRTV